MILNRLAQCSIALLLAMASATTFADVTIVVNGLSNKLIPVAIADFQGESTLKQSVTPIIRADLARSGQFKVVDASGPTMPADVVPPDLANWKTRGADSLAVGGVRTDADGSIYIRLRLYDTVTLKRITGVEIHAAPDELRRAAHQAADVIYQALTGDRGIFDTKIAYVLKRGKNFQLQVADADGFGAQMVFGSHQPIMSPTWSADGQRLAYVSFERQKPIVYVQNVYTGARKAVAAYKGSNSGPAFSPDGRTMAVTLTINSFSQIYLINIDGSNRRRLMQTPAIDTEANFSPDGQSIAFTSDRGGTPQLYVVPNIGGDAQRISFDGKYNVTPRFAPDGKSLAFVHEDDSQNFNVATIDLTTHQMQVLTNDTSDESPTFAPNGKLILYATEVGGRGELATVSIDGQVHQRLSTQGDVREPAWGPFPSQLPMTRLSSNP